MKNQIFDGYNDKTKSPEVARHIYNDYPEYFDNLERSFLNNEFVKKHFANPKESWDEVSSLNCVKNPDRLPARMATVVRSYSAIVDEDADNEDGIDTDRSFENALFSAYYDECAHSKSRFLRQWADFDRNLRNISAAVVARVTGRSAEQSVVGGDETSQQLKRSSAADFGLRGDVPYLEAVIAAVNDETNLVEKERKIDAIRWNQAEELSTFDYFDINALLAYLVKVNIVARWTRLDDKQGREMLHRLMTSLDGKDLINKQ